MCEARGSVFGIHGTSRPGCCSLRRGVFHIFPCGGLDMLHPRGVAVLLLVRQVPLEEELQGVQTHFTIIIAIAGGLPLLASPHVKATSSWLHKDFSWR